MNVFFETSSITIEIYEDEMAKINLSKLLDVKIRRATNIF